MKTSFKAILKNTLHPAFFAAVTVIGASMSPAYAGHATGNGGDHVRATFQLMGNAVAQYLVDTKEGADLLAKNSLSIDRLKASLEVAKIDVVEGGLLDNGGVPVDATGTLDKITLNKSQWIEHFEKDRDVYYLVLHEMLRSISVNDDDYLISKAIRPFPVSRRVITRISSIYPLVGEDEITPWLKIDKLIIAGPGCPVSQVGTSVDVDSERNTLSISLERLDLATTIANGKSIDRKSCNLAIPISVPAGRRLVISQLDITAKFELAPKAAITVASEAFLAGLHSPQKTKAVRANEKPLVGRLLDRRTEVLRTSCGGDAILRLNTAAELKRLVEGDSAASLDRISISLKSEPCQK